MKKIVILMVLIMSCIGISAMASDTGKSKSKTENAAAIELKSRSHDFGTIKESDGKVSCEFEFTNTGKAPLVIISATAGCGCTSPEYPDAPVASGAKSAIKVTYNPKGRPGEFIKNVTVRTNDPKNGKVVLKISGNVLPENK